MAIQEQLCTDNFGFSLGESQNGIDSSKEFDESCLNLQQKTQSLWLQNNGVLPNYKDDQDLGFYVRLWSQIEKQRQEVDRFICLQNERLKLALQDRTKQQMWLLLRNCEAKADFLLKQKDEEISKSMTRTGELEDSLRRIEIEKQSWQRLATQNEAMVSYLNKKIKQLKETACFATHWVEDAESCCEEGRGETGENSGEEDEQRRKMCKGCCFRESCVIFLPCRHLCSCESCQAFLNSCPVCGVVKKATVEVVI